jgi:hypothetical protein
MTTVASVEDEHYLLFVKERKRLADTLHQGQPFEETVSLS